MREFPVAMDALVELSGHGSFQDVLAALGPPPSGLPTSRRDGIFLTPDQYYVGDVHYEGWPTHTVWVEMPGPGVGPCYQVRRALELARAAPELRESVGAHGEPVFERGGMRTHIQGSKPGGGCLEQVVFTVKSGAAAE